MAINYAPPPRAKKKGLGCLGAGCLIVALLAVLFLGLMGGGGYMVYQGVLKLTSTTPATIPTFDGGDDVYNRARQKMTDFNHDVQNHQAATIHLTADEINTLLARNPSFTEAKVHLFVAFNNDQARLQWSCPTSLLPYHLFPNRYFNGTTTFQVNFDSNDKTVNFDPKTIQIGAIVLLDANGDNTSSDPNAAFNQVFMKSFIPDFNRSFNQGLRKNAADTQFLDQTKSIEIKNGELVIETQ